MDGGGGSTGTLKERKSDWQWIGANFSHLQLEVLQQKKNKKTKTKTKENRGQQHIFGPCLKNKNKDSWNSSQEQHDLKWNLLQIFLLYDYS